MIFSTLIDRFILYTGASSARWRQYFGWDILDLIRVKSRWSLVQNITLPYLQYCHLGMMLCTHFYWDFFLFFLISTTLWLICICFFLYSRMFKTYLNLSRHLDACFSSYPSSSLLRLPLTNDVRCAIFIGHLIIFSYLFCMFEVILLCWFQKKLKG